VFPRPALIALQFLTRLPLQLDPAPRGRELGLSLLWYPAVGFLLGLLLWGAASALSHVAPLLTAAILLALWVLCTGALHLDGLADMADAWVGGYGDRQRTLSIMKDPYSGPVAVSTVVCVLLLKVSALAALCDPRSAAVQYFSISRAYGFVLPPLLARAAIPALFANTPYVREHGIGAELAAHQSRGLSYVVALVAITTSLIGGRRGVLSLVAAASVYVVMRQGFVRRLGGVTGDCAGAMIELIETVTLVTIAAVDSYKS
jgi:adenosylcobinamide-GDP ribazoletransferase